MAGKKQASPTNNLSENGSADSDSANEFEVIMYNPTKEFNRPFLYATISAKRKLYPYDLSQSGKWMMFFDKSILDEKWKMCCDLYQEGKLTGITAMKVSTNYTNPRASDQKSGVIIFYCGPANDENAVMEYGKNLLEMIPYTPKIPYIFYKSDEQTFAGTRATGQKKNHLYKIPIPVLPESWRSR